jgi:hypothetical protein
MQSENKLLGLNGKPVMHHFLRLIIICKSMTLESPVKAQTDGNLKVEGSDCMLDGRELQISAPKGVFFFCGIGNSI